MDLPKKHVFIHHGPYETCGIVSYQTERLEGMQKLFKSKGHKVDLHEISDRNSVELWVKGELIYKCSIKSLEFGKFTF